MKNNLPGSVVYVGDVTYKSVGGSRLLLDVYLPDDSDTRFPVVVCIHGGAWYAGDKAGEVQGFSGLVQTLLENKIAVVSIDYRLSQQAIFPAQIQDCNDAINFICMHSKEYKLDVGRIAVMGSSAGGHLAALVATSNSHDIPEFYSDRKKPRFKISGGVDFFGPSDFIAMRGNSGTVDHDLDDAAEARLLGHPPLKRPDLAKWASPTTYVDANCPPFLIFHGDKDPVVQFSQSILLNSYLQLAKVETELVSIEGAGHGGPAFTTAEVNQMVVQFLGRCFK